MAHADHQATLTVNIGSLIARCVLVGCRAHFTGYALGSKMATFRLRVGLIRSKQDIINQSIYLYNKRVQDTMYLKLRSDRVFL